MIRTEEQGIKSNFRIIYYIHGDGSYLYHDSTGRAIYADERMLKQALFVAKENKEAEVYIFHQGSPGKSLFFFPQKNGRFYFFRNGELIARNSIAIENETEGFNYLISQLISHSNKDTTIHNIYLYYGHSIAETEDSSSNEGQFTISKFVQGLSSSGLNYDLVVLSTCYNGTPYTIKQLMPVSKYIIASPSELYLSNISSLPLRRISSTNYTPWKVVNYLAKFSFEKLKRETTTMITVCLYDSQKLYPYIAQSNFTPAYFGGEICGDCRDLYANFPDVEKGIKVYYRAPAFGKDRNKKNHSGWGCPQQKELGSRDNL